MYQREREDEPDEDECDVDPVGRHYLSLAKRREVNKYVQKIDRVARLAQGNEWAALDDARKLAIVPRHAKHDDSDDRRKTEVQIHFLEDIGRSIWAVHQIKQNGEDDQRQRQHRRADPVLTAGHRSRPDKLEEMSGQATDAEFSDPHVGRKIQEPVPERVVGIADRDRAVSARRPCADCRNIIRQAHRDQNPDTAPDQCRSKGRFRVSQR